MPLCLKTVTKQRVLSRGISCSDFGHFFKKNEWGSRLRVAFGSFVQLSNPWTTGFGNKIQALQISKLWLPVNLSLLSAAPSPSPNPDPFPKYLATYSGATLAASWRCWSSSDRDWLAVVGWFRSAWREWLTSDGSGRCVSKAACHSTWERSEVRPEGDNGHWTPESLRVGKNYFFNFSEAESKWKHPSQRIVRPPLGLNARPPLLSLLPWLNCFYS